MLAFDSNLLERRTTSLPKGKTLKRMIIEALLVIGGVEQNPGPAQLKISSCKAATSVPNIYSCLLIANKMTKGYVWV